MAAALSFVCVALIVGFAYSDGRPGSPEVREPVRKQVKTIIKECPHEVTADVEDLVDFALTHYPDQDIPENFACFLECAMKSFDKTSMHMDEFGGIHLDKRMFGAALPQYQACVDKLTETNLCKKAHIFYSTCMKIPVS